MKEKTIHIDLGIHVKDDLELFEVGIEFGFFLASLRQKDILYVLSWDVVEEGDEDAREDSVQGD